MKRLLSVFIIIVLLIATGAIAEQKFLPTKPNSGTIGTVEKAWSTAAVGRMILPEVSAPTGYSTRGMGKLVVTPVMIPPLSSRLLIGFMQQDYKID